MKSIVFVCHGNICRSPMAEFILKSKIISRGLEEDFFITSAATSSEEIGHEVYPAARKELERHGISSMGKRAVQLKSSDYAKYDYVIVMEDYNLKNLPPCLNPSEEKKIWKLLDFESCVDLCPPLRFSGSDIADPWYYGRFDETFRQISLGCEGLLSYLNYKRRDC